MYRNIGLWAIAGFLLLAGVGFGLPHVDRSTLPPTSYIEHGTYYDIFAMYPGGTTLPSAADRAAIARMGKFVRDTVAVFKKQGNFTGLTPEDIKNLGFDQGRKETLHISYFGMKATHTVSYLFTVYEDTLGAHGNTYFHTFVFDLASGASLSLADMFLPGSDYLHALSTIARAKLSASLGDQAAPTMIQSGTEPISGNFQNFFVENTNLGILFDPYQVAPYAAGPQTLRIPFSELSVILKPEYQ